jgi:hypothetical protein
MVPMHSGSLERIEEYLVASGQRGTTDTALAADGVYQILKHHGIRA